MELIEKILSEEVLNTKNEANTKYYDHSGAIIQDPQTGEILAMASKQVKDGVIIDRAFTRDYEFNAPSAASAVILGHTSNGNVDWKTSDGTKLKDL